MIDFRIKVPSLTDTWVEHTLAFDRVKGVALTISEPPTAAWVAEKSMSAVLTRK